MRFKLSTTKRQEMIDITEEVNAAIGKSNIKEGICNVFVLHSSAAICICENWDDSVPHDMFKALNEVIPQRNDYKHDDVDGNAQSHILATVIGPSESIPVRDGELLLGKWQSLMLAELDGPRERSVEITIVD